MVVSFFRLELQFQRRSLLLFPLLPYYFFSILKLSHVETPTHCTNENKIAIIISSIVCTATLTWSLMEFNGQTKATTATKYNPGEFWECLLFVSPTAMLYQLSYEVLLEEGQEQVQFLPLYNETEMMCTPDVPRRRESKKKRYFCKLTEITTVPSFPWSTLECSRGAVVISSASKICQIFYYNPNILPCRLSLSGQRNAFSNPDRLIITLE